MRNGFRKFVKKLRARRVASDPRITRRVNVCADGFSDFQRAWSVNYRPAVASKQPRNPINNSRIMLPLRLCVADIHSKPSLLVSCKKYRLGLVNFPTGRVLHFIEVKRRSLLIPAIVRYYSPPAARDIPKQSRPFLLLPRIDTPSHVSLVLKNANFPELSSF